MQDRYAGWSGTYYVDPATGERKPDLETEAALRLAGHPDHPATAPAPDQEPPPAAAESVVTTEKIAKKSAKGA